MSNIAEEDCMATSLLEHSRPSNHLPVNTQEPLSSSRHSTRGIVVHRVLRYAPFLSGRDHRWGGSQGEPRPPSGQAGRSGIQNATAEAGCRKGGQINRKAPKARNHHKPGELSTQPIELQLIEIAICPELFEDGHAPDLSVNDARLAPRRSRGHVSSTSG
jgi:hypothetical protein